MSPEQKVAGAGEEETLPEKKKGCCRNVTSSSIQNCGCTTRLKKREWNMS
ncbi:hypothetical protein TIFTF001_024723 [Ficus carica]|uniref:Uncharacterized protein n=1 Tax=Ficus carica TaxID=3494 RepID=A0AA88DH06_FICCA|nr:hypothetical protein TIFTF001_024723 [Ficus carica]